MNRCGDCKHWQEKPKRADGPQIIGGDKSEALGECYESPPQIAYFVLGTQVQMRTEYPTIPAKFRGCSRFEARKAANVQS